MLRLVPWIALVGPEFEENLSLRYLASSLAAAGFATTIIPFNHEQDLPSIVQQLAGAPTPPLLVGLSLAFQWRAKDFLALAMALRQAGHDGHITAGGHFATFEAREILNDFPELDSICRQESEETIVTLARAVEHGTPLKRIPGLALRDEQGRVFLTEQPSLPDLARLPWPDRRGEPAVCFGHAIAPLVGSRGCYANCTFCCIAAWHEETQPGKRYRLRDVEDIADEMVSMQRRRGIDIFVFHDDNFFVPGHKRNAERFSALADALESKRIGPFATVVKARPTDVNPEVFRILKERLHCIRVYVGIETDADQGLETLGRWAQPRHNRDAIKILRELDMYACFNMLIFDPDTTIESLETNIAFIREAAEFPFNFGRVELYAGTPLLARMQNEKRCWGDYMQWDYDLASPEVERIFSLSMRCFHQRNFGDAALANDLMGTRFDVSVAGHFHSDRFEEVWLDEGKRLTRELALDSADALSEIVEHVKSDRDDADLVPRLSRRLRRKEREIRSEAMILARSIQRVIGGTPLTEVGDRVATSLQTAREVLL
jgi:anaerobic magnesium-protoporphyrin IX monomethyl ester cyclase